MYINSKNFNINFKQGSVQSSKTSFLGIRKSTGDTFIKNTEAENVQSKLSSQAFRKLYDETYDEVIAQNPISRDLNIKKPNLVFDDDPDYPNHSTYTFCNNTIKFSLNFLQENTYLVAKNGKDGKILDYYGIIGEEELKSPILKLKTLIMGLSPIKLSFDEKKTFVQGIMAHELRHTIQEHLIASTEGCGEEYRKKYIEPINEIKQIISKLEKCNAKNLDTERQKLQELEELTEYVRNFKPKKLIKDDFALQFSTMPDDNRYWSTREHFYKNNLKTDDNSKAKYYASPAEIDANQYAAEFVMKKNDMNNEIKKGIAAYFMQEAQTGLSNMQKYGYSDLIEK